MTTPWRDSVAHLRQARDRLTSAREQLRDGGDAARAVDAALDAVGEAMRLAEAEPPLSDREWWARSRDGVGMLRALERAFDRDGWISDGDWLNRTKGARLRWRLTWRTAKNDPAALAAASARLAEDLREAYPEWPAA